MGDFVFTSESVSPGHPDKLADQISDAVVDAAFAGAGDDDGKRAGVRVACETLIKDGKIVVAGEMRPLMNGAELQKIAAGVVRRVGYDRSGEVFNADSFEFFNWMGEQSGEIAQGVDGEGESAGAGDQGLMFGYACDETPSLMPLPLDLAHRLMRRHGEMRAELAWLRPDAKSQVTVRYENDRPVAAEAVVLSAQHDAEVAGVSEAGKRHAVVREAVTERIIAPVLAEAGLSLPAAEKIHVNPTGAFVQGGPEADCGLTGRKIVVDTYGGAAPHGGGAFSGKDPTKVDRSAAYVARYLAKNIVAAGLARKCLVQIAYAIGEAQPVSLYVETYGGGDGAAIEKRVRGLCADGGRRFDLTPAGVIRLLDLRRAIYEKTAVYGHFGSNPHGEGFPWERTDLAGDLR